MNPVKLFAALWLAVSLALASATGEEIPSLHLMTLDGKPASLDRWVGKGKWVLVMFWAVNCHVCDQNKPAINAFYDKHHAKDATVIGVSIDGVANVDSIRAKLKRSPLHFPNYVVNLGEMAGNYEIAALEPFRGTPTYWFFSPSGELKAVNPGPVRVVALEKYMARFGSR